MQEPQDLPAWLQASENYVPQKDADGFIRRSLLSVGSVLAQLRAEAPASRAYEPSAVFKLCAVLVLLLLNSLSANFAFTLVLLALALAFAVVLPPQALKRALSLSAAAALLTFLVMLPAVFLGQPRSALTLATKSFVAVLFVMSAALTLSLGELTGALRSLRVPSLVILTLELSLKSLYSLGTTCSEVLGSLSLRSVGKNRNKGKSLGNVGGVVLVKAKQASEASYDSMRCRGFDGSYRVFAGCVWKRIDVLWLLGLLAVLALFVYLEAFV